MRSWLKIQRWRWTLWRLTGRRLSTEEAWRFVRWFAAGEAQIAHLPIEERARWWMDYCDAIEEARR